MLTSYLSLLSLPKSIIQKVSTNRLSFGHAKALTHLKSEKDVITVAKKIIEHEIDSIPIVEKVKIDDGSREVIKIVGKSQRQILQNYLQD